MAKDKRTFDIGREMAAAPLTTNAIEEAMKVATDPQHMDEVTRQAAVESSIRALDNPPNTADDNSIARCFGVPAFELGERKMYPDKDNPLKSNGRLARIILPLAACPELLVKASVYLYTEKLATGQTRKETRVSLPQAIEVNADNAQTVADLDTFKDTLLDGYFEWAARVQANAPTAAQTSTPRGRRVEIA